MEEQQVHNQELKGWLDYAMANHASDLHLLAGSPAAVRIDGKLRFIDQTVLSGEQLDTIITSFIGEALSKRVATDRKELDFAFSYQHIRLRCNIFYVKGTLSASMRLLSNVIPDLAELGVPPIVAEFTKSNQGLVIVTGPTGHGKSTTLASLTNRVAQERQGHIVTIEDPIEFLLESKKCIVSQREVGIDTPSFGSALRSVLREDPDVVLLGEMRDLESIETALQIAETGHLVFTTLHTNSAAQTADRIISVFPATQQNQIRQQLSEMLLGVVSQRLLPKIQGGRVLASEVMVVNSAIRAVIRDGKTHQIPNILQTSAADGMISLDKSLADLVAQGTVAIDDALKWSVDPKSLKTLIY